MRLWRGNGLCPITEWAPRVMFVCSQPPFLLLSDASTINPGYWSYVHLLSYHASPIHLKNTLPMFVCQITLSHGFGHDIFSLQYLKHHQVTSLLAFRQPRCPTSRPFITTNSDEPRQKQLVKLKCSSYAPSAAESFRTTDLNTWH